MSETWTLERLVTLKELYASGIPQRVIARQMHLSFNAVIGKVHRLKKKGELHYKPLKRACEKPIGHAAQHSEEIIARAKRGETDRMIAVALNLTMGQVRHHRISRGIPGNRNTSPPGRKSEIKTGATGERIMAAFSEGYRGQTGRISILELCDGLCHFPIDQDAGPVRYCGGETERNARWCPEHMARCIEKVPRSKKLAEITARRRAA